VLRVRLALAYSSMARQLLYGRHVTPRSHVESSLLRQALRCTGASYVVFAAAFAIAALLARDAGRAAILAVVMLAPVAFAFTSSAVRSGATAAAVARSRRVRASVGRALADLGKEYRIVPGLYVSPDREDLVAIGPNGIFVVVARDDHGRVTASSRRLFVNARPAWRDLVEDCRVDALRVHERVRRELGHPLPVYAVLCFARALVAVGQEIRGVKIAHASRLARLIASTPSAAPLSRSEIELAAVALTTSTRASATHLLRPAAQEPRPQLRTGRRLALVGRAPAHQHDAP